MRGAFDVEFGCDRVVKFFPSNPPEKGDVVLVNDERCQVVRARVSWDGPCWTIRRLRVRPT